MTALSHRSAIAPIPISEELQHRRRAIKARSEKIVALRPQAGGYQDIYDRASILRAAGTDTAQTNRALAIIQKVQSGESLTPEENEYEITSLEELQGTLLPTLEWQYGRRRDHYVGRRALESLDEQIDRCIDLLLKNDLSLADLPADFDWCENNAIELIYNEKGNERFFKRLFADLHNAQQHINMAMFGIKGKVGNENDIAWQAAKALVNRAAAGVEVNLLIDAKGCGLSWLGRLPDGLVLMDWLRQHGVNIMVNNPLRPGDLRRFLRLDHRKLYIIDGKIGYCGGMGIENQFYDDWFDVMLRLEGEIVHQLQMHFLSTFRWQGGQIARPDQTKSEIRQRYFPPLKAGVGKQKAKLLASIPAPGRRAISESYVNALENTHESFYFMNPYCFTDWLVAKLTGLAEMLYQNGHIWRPQMATPSGVVAFFPGAGFTFPMEEARRHEYKALKRAGLGLLIYPGGLHGKLYVQDGRFSNVGSFNIDDASLERNWETNVLIDDKEFSQHLIDELFRKKEHLADVKVESELKESVVDWMKQSIADAIDFVI